MKASFNLDGSIQIVVESIEERIILEQMHNLHGNGSTITFVKDGNRLVASPQTMTPPMVNKQNLENKHGVVFTPEQVKTILDFLTQGAKLGAVKYVKEVTGLGLKDAKELLDEFPMIRTQQDLNKKENIINAHIFTFSEVAVILGYIDKKERLTAIRFIKEVHGIDIDRAKIEFDKFLKLNAHILHY